MDSPQFWYKKSRGHRQETLKMRLMTELGSPAEINLKGKQFRNTLITSVTDTFMRAGSVFVPFHRASVITLGKADPAFGYELIKVEIKGIGAFEGTLVRHGQDYIELENDETDRVIRRLIPLNRYVRVETVLTFQPDKA